MRTIGASSHGAVASWNTTLWWSLSGPTGTDAVAGALTFRDSADRGAFREVLDELRSGAVHRIAFAVPAGGTWPLGIYELALLTAAQVHHTRLPDIELTLVTPEARPLAIFGKRASESVSKLLDDAGITLRLSSHPRRFENGRLIVDEGEPIDCGRPSSPTARPARSRRWRALRETHRSSGRCCEVPLLTEWGPRFMRSRLDDTGGEAAAKSVLWRPPARVAGKFLAPYLAAKAGYKAPARPLEDLAAPEGDLATELDSGHEDAVAVALSSASASAEARDFRGALRWLEVAEDLDLYLPSEYELKRISWRELERQR